jgi:hypothetical protein
MTLMRRGLVSGLIAILLSAAVASAAVINAGTTVTISGRKLKGERVLISGILRSRARPCTQDKPIRLYVAVRDKQRHRIVIRPLRLTHTNRLGRYRFVLRPRHSETLGARFPGYFRSSYAGEEYCHASWSGPLRVIVRPAPHKRHR